MSILQPPPKRLSRLRAEEGARVAEEREKRAAARERQIARYKEAAWRAKQAELAAERNASRLEILTANVQVYDALYNTDTNMPSTIQTPTSSFAHERPVVVSYRWTR